MAGDWIKMRSNLRRHPKVVRIASALNADRLRVVGGLHAVWCLFDEHSEDGQLSGYTPSAVDEEIGWPGFTQALIGVGWVDWDGNDGLSLPEFDTHNGASAKRRAQEADRKRAERGAAKERAQDGEKSSASDADKKRTREEKRREEKKKYPPQPPVARGEASPDVGFDRFWAAWPAHPRKAAKRQCLAKWQAKGLEVQADAIVAKVEALKTSAAWTKDGGEYIPAPLVWLNQDRWEAPTEAQAAEEAEPWWNGPAKGVRAKGIELGVGDWNELDEQWPSYKRRVLQAAGISVEPHAAVAAQVGSLFGRVTA